MLGAESVLGAMRATPVQLDMRPHWIETSMAEQLGLQDGQVVGHVAIRHALGC